MCQKTGCCGSFLRVVVTIINVILLLVGLGFVAGGAVLKFTSVLDSIEDLDTEAKDLIEAFQPIAIFMIVFGVIVFVVSIIGMIGTCSGNRWALIIYDVVIGLLFLAHLGVFIYFLTQRDSVENEIDKVINDVVQQIINPTKNQQVQTKNDLIIDCGSYETFTDAFNCCDFNKTSQAEFFNACCPSSADKTCTKAIISLFSNYVIILPNSILIAVEFLVFISVIIIIVQVTKFEQNRRSAFEMHSRY